MPVTNPERVRIVEVGPRDGLQNESTILPTEVKLGFVGRLIEAGLTDIEVASFVSPRHVPQMGDAAELVGRLPPAPGVTFMALVPNLRGLERAIETGIKRIAIFTAASDTFCTRNIGMSVERSLDVYGEVARTALAAGLSVRAYISTSFVCPFEGDVRKERVREITERLLELGADEIAISDTIGAAGPREVTETVGYCLERVAVERIALHFHDTYGTAPANVLAGLQLGVRRFDASAGGIGGCPFAPGGAGNLATEDLVYLLERMGLATGVSIEKVVAAAQLIAKALGRDLPSRNYRRLTYNTLQPEP